MGFDVTNIISPAGIRNENYESVKPLIQIQREKIIVVIGFYPKGIGASGVYNYLKLTNMNQELYPLTSIRARMTEMHHENELIYLKKKKSEIYNSTEAHYRLPNSAERKEIENINKSKDLKQEALF